MARWPNTYRPRYGRRGVNMQFLSSPVLAEDGSAAVPELMADHATFKAAADAVETLIEELAADHATNKALLDEALFKLAFLVHRDQNRSTTGTSPVFAIDTNFDVKNTETCAFIAAGVPYTLTDNTSCDTGTSKTITASQWAAFVIDASDATTLTATWTTGSVASEALALAAARAIPFVAGKARLGMVAVNAHASGFTAGTDALTGGAGGNVATATNYYQFFDLVPVTATTSAATLSASTAIPSAPATLTATVPSGTAILASGTTTVAVESPYVEGYVESLSIRGDTAAVSASGTVLVTFYKWDAANAAAVALNTAVSIEAAGLTALKAAIDVPVTSTLTQAERTKLAADTFYAEIVSNNAIGTAPVRVQLTVGLSQTK